MTTHQLLKFTRVVERNGEEAADEQQVEELLLDFGVHEYLVRHVGDEGGQVDSRGEPGLTHHTVDLSQRDHVFALKALPCAHTRLILAPQAHLAEMLDQRDENVLWVVLLKGQVFIGRRWPTASLSS